MTLKVRTLKRGRDSCRRNLVRQGILNFPYPNSPFFLVTSVKVKSGLKINK